MRIFVLCVNQKTRFFTPSKPHPTTIAQTRQFHVLRGFLEGLDGIVVTSEYLGLLQAPPGPDTYFKGIVLVDVETETELGSGMIKMMKGLGEAHVLDPLSKKTARYWESGPCECRGWFR